MNKKGFTLVELLATMAILGIITSIAVVSTTRISAAVRTKQRDNKISRIEVAASKYAYVTGQTVVFVDTLINDGYLDSDDDEGNVLDPVDNKILNCYVVEITKKGTYYDARFIDNDSYTNNSGCDTEQLYSNYAGISIDVYKNSVKVNSNEWLSGNLVLTASSNSLTIDCTIPSNCIWTSSSGTIENGSVSKNITSGNLEYTANYIFTYKTTVDGKIKNYSANINLKIDAASPVITSVMDSGSSSASVIVTEHGSGVKEVCLNNESIVTNNCVWESIGSNNFTTKKVSTTGNYYVHVKDKAGNIGHSNSVRIIYRG